MLSRICQNHISGAQFPLAENMDMIWLHVAERKKKVEIKRGECNLSPNFWHGKRKGVRVWDGFDVEPNATLLTPTGTCGMMCELNVAWCAVFFFFFFSTLRLRLPGIIRASGLGS